MKPMTHGSSFVKFLRLLSKLLPVLCLAALSVRAGAQKHSAKTLSRFDAQVDELLTKLTLAEKIGQMTQAEQGQLRDLSEIKSLALGSVLSGGGSDPAEGNDLQSWTKAVQQCQQQALASRLGIPLLYGIDAVHGHGNVLNAVIFPHHIGLGCTRDAALVEEVNRITALEVRASGINWNFAPCIAVPRDIRWGRTYEGFGEDPELVAHLGAAAVRGLQGDDLADPTRLLACAKHFLGDGGTLPETRGANWEGFGDDVRLRLDQGDLRCDEATLRRIHLAPYLPAIRAGVGSIMPSYSSWNGVKCSAHKWLLTDLLKGELGFEGFLISDYNAIDQLDKDYKQAIRQSVNAGMDMFMVPAKYREFIGHLTALVNEGSVSQQRIDDAVRRILRVKAAMGLLEPKRSHLASSASPNNFGTPEHRRIAREAVRKSAVLLKNHNAILPLDKHAQITVVGKGANDLGRQCGGWTIEWQGAVGEVTTGGVTILEGLRQVAGDAAKVSYSPDGNLAANTTAIIAVVGELPYAEGAGDGDDLRLSAEDRHVVSAACRTGLPVVLVVLSGRPMILGDALDSCDGVLAAWLPGTEGSGIADVLYGDFAPTGKLSVTWPTAISQEPINRDEPSTQVPAFPYGFGLGYKVARETPPSTQ